MESAKEIGTKLVNLYRDGKAIEAIEKLYDDNVVSVEASQRSGLSRELVGKSGLSLRRTNHGDETPSPSRQDFETCD